MNDQYGRPIPGTYGVPSTAYVGGASPGAYPYGEDPSGSPRPAVIRMPGAADMGGHGPVPWVRYPYFPTAPFYSTDPNVGYQTRYYSSGILSTDVDYTVNAETIRTVQFDIPCRLIALNGASFSVAAGNALPVGLGPRDTFLFRLEYTTGDRLHIASRLASTVLGTQEGPGELGGTGWTIDQGAAVILGITPLLPSLRIDITMVCLEMRGPRNYAPR
jgi:hypothetical protein